MKPLAIVDGLDEFADHGAGMGEILSAGRAAFNRAVKYQMLTAAPHIFQLTTADAKRSRQPKGRPLSIEELGKLFDAAVSMHMLRYLMIACATLARPAAVLDLGPATYDKAHQLLDLNPPDREQNKKYRPLLPVAPVLRPWLEQKVAKHGRYVSYRGKPLQEITGAWRVLRRAAGLDEKVTPYSLRHTMSREMRKRRVPTEEIGLFLGHRPDESVATTTIYAPYEPDFMANAVTAIEDVFAELEKIVRPGLLVPPSAGRKSELRQMKSSRAHPTEVREKARALILAGVPHARVVKETGMSSGTVSAIRKEIKASGPLLRADPCVTVALSEESP